MSYSAQAAITKYHSLGGLNNQKVYFLTVLEAGTSKMEVPAWSSSGEDALVGLQMAAFSLCLHMEERERERERERELSSVSSYKGTNPIRPGLHHNSLI